MKKILLGFLLVVGFSGCLKNTDEVECNYNECSYVAPAAEIAAVQSYLSSNNITGATQHCSGLFYKVTADGNGAKPNFCSTTTFSYVGKLTNGNTFDQGTITYNLAELIVGFRNGIPQIKAGGKITLYVPPSLGYGSQQAGSIPPNSILIFTVDLLSVQ